MRAKIRKHWPILLLAFILASLLTLTLLPYNGNVSALFHLDTPLAENHVPPSGFVVLSVPAYDGAQYYQLARTLPLVMTGQWEAVRQRLPGPYAWQRILLPVLAFTFALGQDALLPWSFLLIQFLCLLGTATLIIETNRRWWPYALALALSPAALIGLHFSLAEPLTIFLLTALLLRYRKRSHLHAFDLFLLSLLVLTREVNILVVGLLFLYSLWKKQWHEALLLFIPAGAFLAWHGVIFGIFGSIPFLWSTAKFTFPFGAVVPLLAGTYGYNRLTLTSIPLALLFVLPALLWSLDEMIRKRQRTFLPLAAFTFLALMTMMPIVIWGSITSIGRVITPVYPAILLHAATRDTLPAKYFAAAVLLLGLGGALALATSVHPFIIL
ncbi:MAG: hypothetical protein WCS85_02795 [Candidatus Peribacteraceae bacterium]